MPFGDRIIRPNVHRCNKHYAIRDRHGRDWMIVGITTTCAISAYHHSRCGFESHPGEMYSMQNYEIKFVSDLRQSVVFSGTAITSINKTDRHDIAKILLKVAMNTINQTKIWLKLSNTYKRERDILITICIYLPPALVFYPAIIKLAEQ